MGLKLEARNLDLRTPLMMAAANGEYWPRFGLSESCYHAAVSLLVLSRLLPLVGSHPPFLSGNTPVASALMDHGADVGLRDDQGRNSIIIAACSVRLTPSCISHAWLLAVFTPVSSVLSVAFVWMDCAEGFVFVAVFRQGDAASSVHSHTSTRTYARQARS
jgi:hypothetical protein